MACTINEGYPGYLKAILKQIEEERNEELKLCACNLTIPQTKEGCAVVASDNTIGGFPFCWTLLEDKSTVGDGTLNPLKLTLKQTMWLYWQSKSFDYFGTYFESPVNDVCKTYQYTWKDLKLEKLNTSNDESYEGDKKKLVCRHSIYFICDLYTKCVADSSRDWEGPSTIGYFFGRGNNNKYIEEDGTYYFYPEFRISYIGGYALTSDTAKKFNFDEVYTALAPPCKSSGEINVNIKINNKSDQFKLYYCGDGKFSPPIAPSPFEILGD